MAYFPDLASLSYLRVPEGVANPFVAIGWLERNEPFPTGSVDREFFRKLVALCQDPFEPMQTRGWHYSSLRQFENRIEYFEFENRRVEGLYWRNLFVPDGRGIFVAPLAILQYIDHYWYLPPSEFVSAVMNCPPTRSIEFKKLFLASGGRPFVRNEAAEPGATDKPDDTQRLREDH